MMIKYAIALAILLVLAAVFAWAFLPARYLPGNRARYLRIRLHLRLHPSSPASRARKSPPPGTATTTPPPTSSRSPPGSAAAPAGTWPSPPAPPAPTS
jgi:hypothetical protein